MSGIRSHQPCTGPTYHRTAADGHQAHDGGGGGARLVSSKRSPLMKSCDYKTRGCLICFTQMIAQFIAHEAAIFSAIALAYDRVHDVEGL